MDYDEMAEAEWDYEFEPDSDLEFDEVDDPDVSGGYVRGELCYS